MSKQIFFLGCGNMGSAIAKILLQQGNHITVVKPSNNNQIANIRYYNDYCQISADYIADVVFLAIKPQQADELLSILAKQSFINAKTIIISMLAGKKLAFYRQIFSNKIMRIMPNLAIEVAKGIVPFFGDRECIDIVLQTFADVAKVIELKQEQDFDAATALFGCGPAYLFLLQEIFTNLAKKYNLYDSELISNLFLGSALMSCQQKISPQDLQQLVASKKGVTASALQILNNNNALANLFEQAIATAVSTSQKL
jgi:pyrroline-5-carboxylate reductase